MQNVATTVKGNKLVIEIDLDKDLGVSSSGKTHIVAKSGFAQIEGKPGFGFTLNAWRPLPAKS
jgi:hypothetical protein